jgi:hypothetical protein
MASENRAAVHAAFGVHPAIVAAHEALFSAQSLQVIGLLPTMHGPPSATIGQSTPRSHFGQ